MDIIPVAGHLSVEKKWLNLRKAVGRESALTHDRFIIDVPVQFDMVPGMMRMVEVITDGGQFKASFFKPGIDQAGGKFIVFPTPAMKMIIVPVHRNVIGAPESEVAGFYIP